MDRSCPIDNLKPALEALLFTSSSPLSLSQLRKALFLSVDYERAVEKALHDIGQELDKSTRGLTLHQVAGGYLLQTKQAYREWVERLPGITKADKLSLAACEVLALLCIKGPLSRPQIEKLRGSDSGGVLQTLIEKELIENKPNSDGPANFFRLSEKFYVLFGSQGRQDLLKLYKLRHESNSQGL